MNILSAGSIISPAADTLSATARLYYRMFWYPALPPITGVPAKHRPTFLYGRQVYSGYRYKQRPCLPVQGYYYRNRAESRYWDQEVCTGKKLLLKAGIHDAVCQWSAGATTQEIEVQESGTYGCTS